MTYASGLPSNLSSYAGSSKRYAGSSVQDDDASSVAGSSIAYSQADRLQRLGTASESEVDDYKSQAGDDDETRSVFSTTTSSQVTVSLCRFLDRSGSDYFDKTW